MAAAERLAAAAQQQAAAMAAQVDKAQEQAQAAAQRQAEAEARAGKLAEKLAAKGDKGEAEKPQAQQSMPVVSLKKDPAQVKPRKTRQKAADTE